MNSNSSPQDQLADLACLDRFTTLFSQDVEPRAASPLSQADKDLITALANGEVNEAQRSTAVTLLAANTTAMEYFTQILTEDDTSQSSGE